MRILTSIEAEAIKPWFDAAAEIATHSGCLRSKCGSVIVKDGQIIGRGFNSPPQNNPKYRTCLAEYDIPAGFRHDRTCCIHAEERAIENARAKNPEALIGATIYFMRLNESGAREKATSLKCTICSRAVLDAGISEFALDFPDGVRVYDTEEFNKLSYEYKTPLHA